MKLKRKKKRKIKSEKKVIPFQSQPAEEVSIMTSSTLTHKYSIFMFETIAFYVDRNLCPVSWHIFVMTQDNSIAKAKKNHSGNMFPNVINSWLLYTNTHT